MHTVRLVSTVIVALVLMGCPPPVGDNPNAPPQGGSNSNDSASGGDNPAPARKHHVAYVSAGGNHTVIVKTDDTLWAVGRNDKGQLGNGDVKLATKLNPVQVMIAAGRPMTEVASVSAGSSHTMILKKNDTLWAVGFNGMGQLGDGTGAQNVTKLNPVQVRIAAGEPMTEVASVSAGSNHTMILKKDDTLWGTGFNFVGQLGDDTTTNRLNPIQVKTAENQPMTQIAQVSAGGSHTMILKKDDTLWAVGFNTQGQLGDGTKTRKKTPIQVMIAADRPMTEVAQISVGRDHTMILKKNSELWAVGRNEEGQLGDGTTTNRLNPVQVKTPAGEPMTEVASISSGADHTMILKKNGELWAIGKNNKGQLGDGSKINKKTPVQVMIAADRPMTEVAQIAAGEMHSMIVKTNGTLWGTGYNKYGQLGDDSNEDKLNPEQITPIDGCHDYLPSVLTEE